MYGWRAEVYDLELMPFSGLRQVAIEALHLKPGMRVLDIGCGTGLSLPALAKAVGPQGHVVGIEQSDTMLARARERAPANTTLHLCGAADALLDASADAALFFFTHDVLQQPEAVAQMMSALKPGARVVAVGLKWAPAWAVLVNCWVWSAAARSLSHFGGLDQPWTLLQAAVPDLHVDEIMLGGGYFATGNLPRR